MKLYFLCVAFFVWWQTFYISSRLSFIWAESLIWSKFVQMSVSLSATMLNLAVLIWVFRWKFGKTSTVLMMLENVPIWPVLLEDKLYTFVFSVESWHSVVSDILGAIRGLMLVCRDQGVVCLHASQENLLIVNYRLAVETNRIWIAFLAAVLFEKILSFLAQVTPLSCWVWSHRLWSRWSRCRIHTSLVLL